MRFALSISILAVSGCGAVQGVFGTGNQGAVLPDVATVETSELAPLDALEDVATINDASVPDATLPPPAGRGSALGTTVVSLGDPAIGGMWLKTPLVTTERPGQVRYRGVVVALTLQPLQAEPGAGSQISARAMQALGASLSDLVEVSVEAI